MRLRDLNFHNNAPGSEGRPRTAQIKSIQKFIGRLKSDSKNFEAILCEMETLNLTKYLEEISALMPVCVTERDLRFFTEVTVSKDRSQHG
jgi:6-phosphogluconolactonase (cycloisomerase 2 family)